MVKALVAALFTAGLSDAFSGVWDGLLNRRPDPQLDWFFQRDLTTGLRSTPYAYINPAKGLEYWPRGSSIPVSGLDAVGFNTEVHNFGKSVEWDVDDRNDDQLNLLIPTVEDIARTAATLPQDIFFDLLLGRTNMLPGTVLAPDGVGLFSTTDASGAARFEVTGGNVRSGSGVASISAVETDLFACLTRWQQMRYRGERLVPADIMLGGLAILHGPTTQKIMEQTFRQRIQGILLGTDAGSSQSNLFQDASRDISLWCHPDVTDNSWYVGLKAAPKKALFEVIRQPLQTRTFTEDNDSRASKTGIESFDAKSRHGGGIVFPWSLIKVSN